MADQSVLIEMGAIGGVVGLKGWLKIKTFTSLADDLLQYTNWYLENKAYQLEGGKVTASGLQVKLVGINDRNSAEQLKGKLIAIPRADFSATAENEYYWIDLIDLAVNNRQGQFLGKVTRIFATGANDVLEIKLQKEVRLIPFVKHYIDSVDLENKKIQVDWGLDY